MCACACVCTTQPLALTGHHGEISAMVFGRRDTQVLLCSASADYIIVWNIELCQKRVDDGKEVQSVVHVGYDII